MSHPLLELLLNDDAKPVCCAKGAAIPLSLYPPAWLKRSQTCYLTKVSSTTNKNKGGNARGTSKENSPGGVRHGNVDFSGACLCQYIREFSLQER